MNTPICLLGEANDAFLLPYLASAGFNRYRHVPRHSTERFLKPSSSPRGLHPALSGTFFLQWNCCFGCLETSLAGETSSSLRQGTYRYPYECQRVHTGEKGEAVPKENKKLAS
ncbi:UNVERIFIED_CONTAM: hypothetical protein K2H54_047357 [Gekko kuhli]